MVSVRLSFAVGFRQDRGMVRYLFFLCKRKALQLGGGRAEREYGGSTV